MGTRQQEDIIRRIAKALGRPGVYEMIALAENTGLSWSLRIRKKGSEGLKVEVTLESQAE